MTDAYYIMWADFCLNIHVLSSRTRIQKDGSY